MADTRGPPPEARRRGGSRSAVVGTGALGRHHVRILASLPEAELVGIYDQKVELAAGLAEEHGTVSCRSLEELCERAEAVVLAVPTFAHGQLGLEILKGGRHLLVEKPMTSTLEEADALLAAKAPGKVLAVGHVEFYNPAVRALLAVGEKPRFLEFQRLSQFTPRSLDVDVVLDLMIHDLQILHALDPSEIAEVRCTGIDVLSQKIDIASARIELASGVTANITASRVSAEPVRKLRAFLHHRYFSDRLQIAGDQRLRPTRRGRAAGYPARSDRGPESRATARRAAGLRRRLPRREGGLRRRRRRPAGARHRPPGGRGDRKRPENGTIARSPSASASAIQQGSRMAQEMEMSYRIGVLGGSGLYAMEALEVIEERRLSTPFGEPSDPYVLGRLDGVPVAFLARHGRGHRKLPTELNYRANIYGFKLLGVEQLVSVSAVGSMKEAYAPTHIVVVDQFYDRTRHRADTFFGQGLVAHVSMADPDLARRCCR